VTILASGFSFDEGSNLSRAIEATFKRRHTPIPEQLPVALTKKFCDDLAKQPQWKAFIRRARLVETKFGMVVTALQGFLMPPTLTIAQGQEFIERDISNARDRVTSRPENGGFLGTRTCITYVTVNNAKWPPGGSWRPIAEREET
jgi:hypothetical protein